MTSKQISNNQQKAFEGGGRARYAGVPVAGCPYYGRLKDVWLAGWYDMDKSLKSLRLLGQGNDLSMKWGNCDRPD